MKVILTVDVSGPDVFLTVTHLGSLITTQAASLGLLQEEEMYTESSGQMRTLIFFKPTSVSSLTTKP